MSDFKISETTDQSSVTSNTNSTFNSAKEAEWILKGKKMDLDSGMLGKWFGNKENAPTYIGGAILLLLVISGIYIAIDPCDNVCSSTKDYWEIITPVITLVFGYLFGKNEKN